MLGDVFLDIYLFGSASRLSREAPIAVLEYDEARDVPGGAANPAMNAAALQAPVMLVGLAGDDDEGRRLRERVQAAGVGDALVSLPGRHTATKTRVVARGSLLFPQQIARLDRVDRQPLDATALETVLARVTSLLPDHDAVLCSDYRSGLLAPELVAGLRAAARVHGCRLCVDAQGALEQYHDFDLVRCNHHEAAAFLGRALTSEADYPPALAEILERLRAGAVVVGRAGEGLSLLGRDTPYRHLPAHNRTEVYDVTGAGDTASAVLALGLAADLPLRVSAALANIAAGLVVRKLGSATTTPEELRGAVGA